MSASLFERAVIAIFAGMILVAMIPSAPVWADGVTVLPERQMSTYSRDGAILSALGVLPDTVEEEPEEEEVLRRVEFLRKVVRLFGGRRHVRFQSGGELRFADAAELGPTDRAVVGAAVGMGLLDDALESRFRPHDAISAAEALVLVLRGRGVDWERHGPYPGGALLAAEDEGLLEELPGLGMTDSLRRGEAYRLLAAAAAEDRSEQFAAGLITGVCQIGEELEGFSADGAETWSLAPEVQLADAGELEAAVGHAVLIAVDGRGDVGFIELDEPVQTWRGELSDYCFDAGKLCVGGEWVELAMHRENAVMWECNGMLTGIVAGHEEMFADRLKRWSETGAEIAVHGNDDGWGSVVVDYWDIPLAVVQTPPDDDPEGELVLLLQTEPVEVPLRLSVEGDEVQVSGDVQSLGEVREGDVVRVATVGGGGWQLHRLQVARERVTGALVPDEYSRRRSSAETLHMFAWECGEELVIDEDAFLGNPAGLRRANWVTLAFDAAGEPVHAPVAVRAGVDVPLLVTDYWEDADGLYVRGDYRGTQTDLPVDMELTALEEQVPLDRDAAASLVQFAEDGDGDVRSIAHTAIPLPGAAGAVTVVSHSAREDCVTLRVGEMQYEVSVQPLIYDAEGEFLSVEELTEGTEVLRFSVGISEVLLVDGE